MMIEQESEFNKSAEYNRMRSPYLEITDLNYSEFPLHSDHREIVFAQMEEQRNKYKLMYDESINQIQQLQMNMAQLINDFKSKTDRHIEELDEKEL